LRRRANRVAARPAFHESELRLGRPLRAARASARASHGDGDPRTRRRTALRFSWRSGGRRLAAARGTSACALVGDSLPWRGPRRVKLVYATPGSQSPTGVVMTETRRRQFLALADEHQTPILEDDYAAELRYRAPAVSALKALDRAGQVVYAGSFSKILFPSLR